MNDLLNLDPDKLHTARAWAKVYDTFDTTELKMLLDENVTYTKTSSANRLEYCIC